MHSRQVLTLGILLLLLAPLLALAQSPQGGGKGGKKGFGGGPPDPAKIFDWMSGGKDVWRRSESDGKKLQMFDGIAAKLGITNGEITRDQFLKNADQLRPQRGGPPPAAPPTADQTAQWDKEAEADFRKRDQNGDGKLNQDEMPGQLRRQLDRFDTNKDGQIDLNEYKAYYRDRQTGRQNNNQGLSNLTITTGGSDDDDTPLKRPDVFRVGNMPKNLPAWFIEYDTDEDGQVGLYEWRQKGKSFKEFQEYDRNQDGFITADEVLRWMAKNGQLDDSPGTVLVQGDPVSPGQIPTVGAPPRSGNPPGPGNFQNKGKGKGRGGKQRGGG